MTEDFYLGNEMCWDIADSDKESALNFSNDLGLPPLVSKVLAKRGFCEPERIKAYFKPSIKQLHSPILLPDMQSAVNRIIAAGEKSERVIIYGDYDVDGITATSILFSFLKRIIKDVSFYIPDRVDEGYGISAEAVEFLSKNHYDLMITVDCGINAKAMLRQIEIEAEKQNRKIDFIITDHHLPDPENIPNAVAVINPHLSNNDYPFTSLCGAGVAFKLVQALCERLGFGNEYLEYVDLAALGTVADIVSLTDENRVIVWAGLNKIQRKPNPGIEALLKVSDTKNGNVDSWKLAFYLAPRINAAGRMGDASRGVKLFTAINLSEAEALAAELNEENYRRQKVQEDIFNKAVEAVEAEPYFNKQKVLVVAGEGWHHGVIGIVASMLAERYNKSCFIIAISGEFATGSARSSGGFNIYSGMDYCKELLIKYGGHEKAGGLTLKTEDISLFRKKINEFADSVLPDIIMLPQIYIDAEAYMEDINIRTAEAINAMAPFGEENEAPVFRMNQVPVIQKKRIGASGEHLKLMLGTKVNYVQAVAFRMGDMDNFIQPGEKLDIVFTIGINEYMGSRNVQLIIKSFRKPEKLIHKNKILLEAVEKVECLDYNEDWLYNGINNKNLELEDITLTREELATLYRHLLKCGNRTLKRKDLFQMADEISRGGVWLNYFKLLSGLFIFDELDVIRFFYTKDGEYQLDIPDTVEKASLDDSMLYSFLQSVQQCMEDNGGIWMNNIKS